MNTLHRLKNSSLIASLVFYGWNIFFIIVLITMETSTRLFSRLIYNVFTSYTPVEYLWVTAALVLTPIGCLLLGYKGFKNDRAKLIHWFYGFQVPFLFLMMFRMFGFHQLTTTIFMWFSLLFLAVIGYAVTLLRSNVLPAWIKTSLNVFRLIVGLGLGLFLLIYIVPIASMLIWSVLTNITDVTAILQMTFVAFILLLFFTFTCTLFFFTPLGLMLFYVRDSIKELKSAWEESQNQRITMGVTLALIVLLTYPHTQPQIEALSVSKSWMKSEVSDSEILSREQSIRAGLLNAYLWDFRYISNTGHSRLVEGLYEEALNVSAPSIQAVHDFLISPFVYDGTRDDVELAAEYYEQIFDEPIERAERAEIVDAMRNHWRLQDVEATILRVDQKQVEVTHRDATFQEKSAGVVEVVFHERFVNHTMRPQEVFYYFSLPANTVVTGMWLGDSDDDPMEFAANIAPRGAAQQAYREIRAQRRDPALLEQVGPSQYRLRVFPIPARQYIPFDAEDEEEIDRPMHLTLQLLCKTNEQGEISLPQLTEKRNVFWGSGQLKGYEADQWFPHPDKSFAPSHKSHTTSFGHVGVKVLPLEKLPTRASSEPMNILIDGSFSMGKRVNQVNELLGNIQLNPASEVFVMRRDALIPQPQNVVEFDEFIGYCDPMQALKKHAQQLSGKPTVIVTDKGSYELLAEGEARSAVVLNQRLDLVHLGGYAPIYEDALMETVTGSGGHVYESAKLWAKWLTVEKPDDALAWQEDDQLIVFQDSADSAAWNSAAALYASRYAMAKSRSKGNLALKQLDELHTMAMKYSFVSPFSSMICLVSDDQQKLLEALSKKEDRFEREVETGKISGNTLNLNGSPEPHEWMLIFFALGLTAYLYREKLMELWLKFAGRF